MIKPIHNYDEWSVPDGPICEMCQSGAYTYFNVWSPLAKKVRLILRYGESETKHPYAMHRGHHGLWSTSVPNKNVNLDGVVTFYTFQVQASDGRWLGETPGIFAKAVDVNGRRAAVIDMEKTNPVGWHEDVRPPFSHNMSDAVIYEMHYRDFSADVSGGMRNRGKYLALTEHGTTTIDGQKTGIDHLVELGITHVHLLPSFDFGSVDEAQPERPQYNWGYDPVNYNVPEGSYSTDAHDPCARIREFKQMVMSLHLAGIRVVMDVVYNHVFGLASSPFECTAPGYFFRWNADGSPSNGSGCGNETASERPMLRKFMIESVQYWVKEYHVDGFRFDLMGLHDLQTMREIRAALDAIDPTILIYGEGWTADKAGLPTAELALKHNVRQLFPKPVLHGADSMGVAVFGDEMRDGLRGPWNDDSKGGFVAGVAGNEESVKFGLVGAVPHPGVDMRKVNYSRQAWALSPSQMISYVSCHDDLCLADRLAKTASRSSLQKLAYTAVLTSRGVPFIWCGDEMMRDRKGVRNCYKSPDSVNAINWALKSAHRDVFDYFRRLIILRRELGFASLEINFLPVRWRNVVAFCNGKAVVVLNASKRTVSVLLPKGEWALACYSDAEPKLQKGLVKTPSQSAVILCSIQ